MAKSVQIQKVNWWHERLADLMIARPERTLGDIARELNVTLSWLSVIKNSDAFIDYWRIRSAKHSEGLTQDVKAKGYAAAELALDALNGKLEREGDIMTTDQLLSVVDITMKRFSPAVVDKQPVINNVFGLVTPQQLADAREKLRRGPVPIAITADVEDADVAE